MQQAQIILRLLFVPHQQLAETVQPRMRSFHPPSAGRLLPPADRFGFLADLPHLRNITAFPHDRGGGLAAVAFIGTQVLATPTGWLGSPNHNAVQCFGQQFHIMPVGPVTISESGTPVPSTSKLRLVPFFPPIRGVVAYRFQRQGSFALSAVNALPFPGNPFQIIVFGQTGPPQSAEESRRAPLLKATVNRRGTAKTLGQRFPLTTRPQHVHNGSEHGARF